MYEGSDAIKAKGVEYLPKTSTRQKPKAYEAYRDRALFYGAMSRTVQGLAGAIFGKAPVIQAPDAVTDHVNDITLAGVPLASFAQDQAIEVLKVGRAGILLDMSNEGGTDARPYWIVYAAENIISWTTAVMNGDTQLTRVVLQETVEEQRGFEYVDTIQYRVCELVKGGYQVTVYKQAANGKEYLPQPAIAPLKRGERLTFIPFVFLNPANLLPAISKPPLLDLVDVNLSHYRSSADLEHARHYIAMPQPWVTGYEGESLEIGSSVAWVFKNAESKVGMLEFTGQGLAALEKALDHKEKLMAILGARLLEGQVTKQEAAETVKLRHSGDAVVLKTIATTIGMGLTQVLRWHCWWAGAAADVDNDQISVSLNTDFVATRLTADELKALTLSLQAGAISWDTYYHALMRGDWAEPGVDMAMEKERIKASEQDMPPPAAAPDDEAA